MEGFQDDSVIMEDQHTSKLPEDLVIHEIVSKLPGKSIIRFMSVSKSWKTRISGNSTFIEAHLISRQIRAGPIAIGWSNYKNMMVLISSQTSKATQIDVSYLYRDNIYPDIMGSCNGLVCLLYKNMQVMLWNPLTRQLRELPMPAANPTISFDMGKLGFGFDVTRKEYKVVRLGTHRTSHEEELLLCTQVFTKNGTVWRDSGSLKILDEPNWVQSSVVVDKALHWAVVTESKQHIVSFDLRDEVLQLFDGPGSADNTLFLGKWNDSLVAFTDHIQIEMIMWESKYSGGVRRWNKLLKFKLALGEWWRLVWGDQFIIYRVKPLGESNMLLVDLKARDLERSIELPKYCSFVIEPYDYVESMVSVF